MLHENPLMADIDVDHWRNMQELLLESSKEKRRILLIHENGELLKFMHSAREEIVRNVDRVDNPVEVAKKVYDANPGKADFVQVLERRAVENYVGRFQDTWRADEDLDVYVNRMFKMMDEYSDGIVTYPGSARTNLGLQWRVGATHEQVKSFVDTFIPANTTVLIGVFEGDFLWASLVLGFDKDKKVDNITTVDPTEIKGAGTWQENAREVVAWSDGKFTPCSLGLFLDRDSAKAFFASSDKLGALKAAAQKGTLLVDPIPASLKDILDL